jgi:hypothetical protein
VAVYGALDGGLHARGRGAAGAPPPYEVIIVAERGEAGLAHFLTLWRAQPLFAFSLVDTPEAEGQLARAGMAVCWRSNQVWWLELPPEVCAAAASGTAAGTAATAAAAAATAATAATGTTAAALASERRRQEGKGSAQLVAAEGADRPHGEADADADADADGAEGGAVTASAMGGATEAGADALREGVRVVLGSADSKKIYFGYSASLARSLARRGVRVAPRVCDPQVAAALLQPGEPAVPTLPQLVRRFSESLPQLARAGGANAKLLAHERGCLAAVRSQAAMVQLAGLLQADGLLEP